MYIIINVNDSLATLGNGMGAAVVIVRGMMQMTYAMLVSLGPMVSSPKTLSDVLEQQATGV